MSSGSALTCRSRHFAVSLHAYASSASSPPPFPLHRHLAEFTCAVQHHRLFSAACLPSLQSASQLASPLHLASVAPTNVASIFAFEGASKIAEQSEEREREDWRRATTARGEQWGMVEASERALFLLCRDDRLGCHRLITLHAPHSFMILRREVPCPSRRDMQQTAPHSRTALQSHRPPCWPIARALQACCSAFSRLKRMSGGSNNF